MKYNRGRLNDSIVHAYAPRQPGRGGQAFVTLQGVGWALLGQYPIVTFQYSSTTLYQVSYHIQSLFFESDNRIYP
jgi:hypothetical protein